MKYSMIKALAVCFLILSLPICASAQTTGDGSGSSGSSGNTGGSGNTSSSGSSGSSGGISGGTDFGTTVDTPTFVDFEGIGSQIFIGRDSSIPFIGREAAFSDRKTSTNNKRMTTPTTSRRATSSRMSSSRTTSGRSGLSSSNNGRSVRAAITADFAFSPMEVSNRTTEFQNRLTRLPNLSVVPEQVNIQFENLPQGNVATLTGTVPSERERKVMKQLLLLEPGVDKVENKLTIQHE